MSTAQKETSVIEKGEWLHDPIRVASINANYDEDSIRIEFIVEFDDFIGITHRIKIQRQDIYLNWPAVMAELIRHGYRFNVLKGGERHVHALLAHHQISEEDRNKALEENRKKQEARKAIEEAAKVVERKKASRKSRLVN